MILYKQKKYLFLCQKNKKYFVIKKKYNKKKCAFWKAVSSCHVFYNFALAWRRVCCVHPRSFLVSHFPHGISTSTFQFQIDKHSSFRNLNEYCYAIVRHLSQKILCASILWLLLFTVTKKWYTIFFSYT